MRTHASIGQLALVDGDEPCGVNLVVPRGTLLGDVVAEDALGRRATADIAEADEEDAHGTLLLAGGSAELRERHSYWIYRG